MSRPERHREVAAIGGYLPVSISRPDGARARPPHGENGSSGLNTAVVTMDSADALEAPRGAWQRWLGIALSVATAALLVQQVSEIGWRKVWAVLPDAPLFYLLFAASYLTLPVSELVIFRRLWALPWRSFRLFLRKRVMNEALLGYSGEAYLYFWARRRPHLRVPALAAVKDVSITSALAGNVATLGLVLALIPFLGGLTHLIAIDTVLARQLFGGVLFVTGVSFALVLFRGRVLSLPASDNVATFFIHLIRLLLGAALLCAAWIVALPQVHWTVWLALGALRLVVSRLPFVPNKDLLFATIAVMLAGSADSSIAALLAACAALTLVGHAIVMAYDWSAGRVEAAFQR